jgi:hypothetical protein
MARLLALAASLLLVGCMPPPRSWSFPSRVYRSSAVRPTRARNLKPSPNADPAAALVERALHERGFRFGTDGTVEALHGYLRDNGRVVTPTQARAGDVVFFATAGAESCADHVGLVEHADPDGRIAFREARGGGVRHSFAHAGEPLVRRDEQGRVLNSFLRVKRVGDRPDTRYYAGEMLCAVLRLERR